VGPCALPRVFGAIGFSLRHRIAADRDAAYHPRRPAASADFSATGADGNFRCAFSIRIDGAMLDALLMFGVAVAEEGLFRGYALVALSQSISFWPAALATSMLFGLMHLVNGGESATRIASAMLFGMVLSYSYRLRECCGLHAVFTAAGIGRP
jgi:hypothetical protein